MGFSITTRSAAPAARSKMHAPRFSCGVKNAYRGLRVENPGLRLYNPSIGRWISRDPIEEEDTANIYSFVRSNPISIQDYLGLARLNWKEMSLVRPRSSSFTKIQIITHARKAKEFLYKCGINVTFAFDDVWEVMNAFWGRPVTCRIKTVMFCRTPIVVISGRCRAETV